MWTSISQRGRVGPMRNLEHAFPEGRSAEWRSHAGKAINAPSSRGPKAASVHKRIHARKERATLPSANELFLPGADFTVFNIPKYMESPVPEPPSEDDRSDSGAQGHASNAVAAKDDMTQDKEEMLGKVPDFAVNLISNMSGITIGGLRTT